MGGQLSCVGLDHWRSSTGEGYRSRPHPSLFYIPSLQVIPLCGNRTFVFLDEDTIVSGRVTENARPSLTFFDLSSDEKPITSFLTLALLDEEGEEGELLQIRLNLGIPIHPGPELQARVPFFVDHSQQMLFVFAFVVDSDGDLVATDPIAIPLSELGGWARAGVSHAEWNEWSEFSVVVSIDDPRRATFTMGSRFVTIDIDAVTQAVIDAQLFPTAAKIPIPLLVHNLSPYRRVRVEWESFGPHCQGVSGVWNTVSRIRENGSYCRTAEVHVEPTSDILMTEDGLIAVNMVWAYSTFRPLDTNPTNHSTYRTVLSIRSRFYPFNRFQFPHDTFKTLP